MENIWEVLQKITTFVLLPLVIGVMEYRNTARGRDTKKKEVDTQAAVQALLRDRIVEKHREAMKEGEVDIYTRDSLDRMFVEYKNLGGNGMIEVIMKEIEELPTTTSETKKENT